MTKFFRFLTFVFLLNFLVLPNALAAKSIDYGPWQSFLSRYVRTASSGVNMVNYRAARASAGKLNKFVNYLEGVKISQYSRSQRLAYWINLYNAETVNLILKHYPVRSIKNISGVWKRRWLQVEGRALSLDDIEHRIIRPQFRNPMAHYALNCASIGCPNLQKTPYTAGNLNGLMAKSARQYVANGRGVKITRNRLYASKIYKWYRRDFGTSNAAIIKHMMRFASPGLRKKLSTFNRISGYYYDWALNG